MFRKDKQQSPRPTKEVKKEGNEMDSFEVKYNTISPYGRLGHWIQFIWRFK